MKNPKRAQISNYSKCYIFITTWKTIISHFSSLMCTSSHHNILWQFHSENLNSHEGNSNTDTFQFMYRWFHSSQSSIFYTVCIKLLLLNSSQKYLYLTCKTLMGHGTQLWLDFEDNWGRGALLLNWVPHEQNVIAKNC